MLLHVIEFAVFTLDSVLLLICSTSSELWGCILSEGHQHLSGKATNLIFTGEVLLRGLTSDKLELSLPVPDSVHLLIEATLMPILLEILEVLSSQDLLMLPEYALKHTSWPLTGMLLMGLNVYSPQMSPALSLWTLI
ncbi:hypothetical protein DSO57_1000773 [Entomophthora muscae]|uniref:Uncharacterized protein n=1 Tax=Entomophthora muscae TaxID=34485 RepID=A0ACC2T8Z7_9FUNG|nr:hypothetical protein DSO57_1000773 [Entomophthora muscae]